MNTFRAAGISGANKRLVPCAVGRGGPRLFQIGADPLANSSSRPLASQPLSNRPAAARSPELPAVSSARREGVRPGHVFSLTSPRWLPVTEGPFRASRDRKSAASSPKSTSGMAHSRFQTVEANHVRWGSCIQDQG